MSLYILYKLIIVQKIKFLWTLKPIVKMERKKRIAIVFLLTAQFLNPMGFDAVQIFLMELTGSFYYANLVLYSLSALFFGLYFLYSGVNPISIIRTIFRDFKTRFMKVLNKS